NADDAFYANEEFQRELFVMAASARLASFSRLMTGIIPGNVFEYVPELIETQQRGTAAIAAAIRSRDADAASAQCLTMLRHHGNRVVVRLVSRHVFQAPSTID